MLLSSRILGSLSALATTSLIYNDEEVSGNIQSMNESWPTFSRSEVKSKNGENSAPIWVRMMFF